MSVVSASSSSVRSSTRRCRVVPLRWTSRSVGLIMVVILGEGWLNGLVQDTVSSDPRELVCDMAAQRPAFSCWRERIIDKLVELTPQYNPKNRADHTSQLKGVVRRAGDPARAPIRLARWLPPALAGSYHAQQAGDAAA